MSSNEQTHKGGARGLLLAAVVILVAVSVAEGIYIFRARQQSLSRPPEAPAASAPAGGRKILYWQDPMHPQYTSDKPGTAPDCGMDLVPVYEGGSVESPPPEGAIKISPEKQQLIGVQYGAAEVLPLSKTIRAVARLSYDETRITRVHSKVEGWIEKVQADFTGQLVRRNQPLMTVYSPELVATEEEYLLALRAQDKLGTSPFRDVAAGSRTLLDSARRRLQLWDVAEEQIAELEKTKKPLKDITIYATQGGFIIARNAYERQRITPETELYAIADLSTIWVLADVYESEVPEVRLGQHAVLTLASFPGRSFPGKISYLYPQVDNATRTLKVRAEFPNPDFALRPDMYGDMELRVDYGRKLVVPKEAVLDSGSEQIVFVSLGNGYFQSRKVRSGGIVGDYAIVLSGLKPGDQVVTSGGFLIDSESNLKAAMTGMSMNNGDKGGAEHPAAQTSGQEPHGPTEGMKEDGAKPK